MSTRAVPATTFLLLMLLVAAILPTNMGDAFDFEFITKTTTTACINFRGSASSPWTYINPTGISKRSAEAFCRTHFPWSITGVITTSDYKCYVSGGEYRYTNTVDCANKSAPLSNCNVTGSTSPTYYQYSSYGAGIKCIASTSWATASTFTSYATYLPAGGTYGTQIGRSLTIKPSVLLNQIRPDAYFSRGTLCIPSNATEEPGSNLARALCRTADLTASSNSTVSNSTSIATGLQMYASNIQCSSSSTATLFNGGCTNTTHYYDEPATECSPYMPEVTCPVRFDIKLGDPIASGAGSGFQLVQLRAEGSTDYDGMMCVYSSYTSNFANVVCREMYGDNIDIAGFYRYSTSTLPIGTKEYLSSVRCISSTYTKLSQCTASITKTANQYPCSSYRGLVSCHLNRHNIVFSTTSTASTSTIAASEPGKGYLMATVASAGQTTPAAVCSDGFDQVAALAACRSIGYTPGPNVSFTVANATSTHAINNVTCPSTAKNLTECKLQYSGTGYKISYAAKQVCSGRVYLDCDLGTPNVQFRMDSSRYLQARIYSDSEWGWVYTGSGVTTKEGYYAMCQYSISSTGDSTITKSYLSISYCPSSATSYTDCTYEYTSGVASSRDFYCSTYYSPSSSSSSSSSSGLGTGATIGLAVGIPAGIVFFVVCFYMNRKKPPTTTPAPDATTATNVEMTPTTNNGLLNVPNRDTSLRRHSVSSGDAAAAGGGIYGNTSPAFNTTTSTWTSTNTTTGPGSPFGYSQNQGPPPTAFPPPQSGGYYPQQQAYPPYGGGGVYGQPVMGTAYNGQGPAPGADMNGNAPYPLGMPNSNPDCAPAPYGRGTYGQ